MADKGGKVLYKALFAAARVAARSLVMSPRALQAAGTKSLTAGQSVQGGRGGEWVSGVLVER